MIKHHPTFELIQSFVAGDLPASLSAGIAMHADMCPKCQQQITQLTEQVAETYFEDDFVGSSTIPAESTVTVNSVLDTLDVEQMIDNITACDAQIKGVAIPEKTVVFNNKPYRLPKAMSRMVLGKTANIGKLARARIQLNEHEIRTSLLQIQPGGGVPEHTHKGFELTLLLDGSFSDEKGEYVKGDFIMLDSADQHHPISEQGCLCYTVANDALHFTQGINKLLNPIGTFIY